MPNATSCPHNPGCLFYRAARCCELDPPQTDRDDPPIDDDLTTPDFYDWLIADGSPPNSHTGITYDHYRRVATTTFDRLAELLGLTSRTTLQNGRRTLKAAGVRKIVIEL